MSNRLRLIRPGEAGRIQEGAMAMDRWRPFGMAVMERWEPSRHISDAQSEMNRLFDSFFGRSSTIASGERMWAPLADMYRNQGRPDPHLRVARCAGKESQRLDHR